MDIFVAKLSTETKAKDLNDLFSHYGTVTSSKIIMDRITGVSKCFGFIEMKNDIEGNTAIEHLNGSKFMGKSILVKKSEPKPQEKRSFKNLNKPKRQFEITDRNKKEFDTQKNERNFNSY